jgi:signal transduction histidine kinase
LGSPGTGSTGDTREKQLVFALCHEVGNLVGAIRLNAYLIDGDASAVALAATAVDIDDSSSRIRSLLALIRPLLSTDPTLDTSVNCGVLARGVDEALDEYGGRGVEIVVEAGDALPDVLVRPESLHHLLVTLAFYGVEEARPKGHVRVAVGVDDKGQVTFRIEDDGIEDESLARLHEGELTGRALACAVGEVILGRLGGSVEVSRIESRTRVVLTLPGS